MSVRRPQVERRTIDEPADGDEKTFDKTSLTE